jgi:hypothetical protein
MSVKYVDFLNFLGREWNNENYAVFWLIKFYDVRLLFIYLFIS